MTDKEDTQHLHNTFVEPLQVETSNSTTNLHCAKLSTEEISTGNQESKLDDEFYKNAKRIEYDTYPSMLWIHTDANGNKFIYTWPEETVIHTDKSIYVRAPIQYL